MSIIIDINDLKKFNWEEVVFSYGFYYGSYLTSDNNFLKAIHGQIVEHMDIELAQIMGKEELVDMKATIIEDLQGKKLVSEEIARRTKKALKKHVKK